VLQYSLSALAGAYALQVFAPLPPAGTVAAVSVLGVAFGLLRLFRPVAAFIAGGLLMWLAASAHLADRLDPARQGETLTITAQLLDVPSLVNGTLRFLVRPLEPSGLPARVRLSWFDPEFMPVDGPVGPLPRLGQVWQLQVRLKRPRGFSNPGGFDYEGWLHRQRIGATGYIKHGHNISENYPLPELQTRMRLHFADRIDALFPAGEARAVLKAITIGARSEISGDQWQLYARTGTSHLMAISGLHIGLAAGGAFLLAWSLIALFVAQRNVRDIALLVAIAFAFGYAELSGFAVPAQRAFLMALLIAAAIILRRQVAVQHVLGLACLLVLASDPLSIYAPGFMLSFLAVALLLWSARSFNPVDASLSRWHPRRLFANVRMLGRIQAVLLFGLMPVTIAVFGRVTILAPLTNMLVVPVFNLATVPASLLGLMLDGHAAVAGDLLLAVAFASVELVLSIIAIVGRWPLATIEPAVSGINVALISGATIMWAILPPGWPGRPLALVALVATALYKPASPAESCLALDVLDVGQGLAVILRTREHVLVYDTGPAFRSGSNTAKLVIEPFLKSNGLKSIDTLVVSHSDLDHSGGVEWLGNAFDIGQLRLGEALGEGRPPGLACRAGDAWQWDGVSFEFLHPDLPGRWQGNDASCVLLVQVGEHKLLITGDIESKAERSIIARQVLQSVDLVVVPHHGSRTSSGITFASRLQPAVAIVSAGYHNRWGFPKPDVVARWQDAGARVLTTARAGAVSRQYCAGEKPQPLRLQRVQARRYWLDQEP
jgi:competence protein ComEC